MDKDTKLIIEMITENPEAVLMIDNDGWWLEKPEPKAGTAKEYADWEEEKIIGEGGGNYGFPVLLALAEMNNLKVEMV